MAITVAIMATVMLQTVRSGNSGQTWGRDYFPNHTLTAHNGEQLQFFDDIIKDKVVAINFIFTGCSDICPMETARLVSVFNLLEDRVGKDVFFYSITIDPENDTVDVLNKYVKQYGIDGTRWKFLTGDKRDIDEIRQAFGLYSTPAEEADLSNHNINLMIGNQATGQWVRRSPFENPYILANQLGSWLHGWKKVSKYTQSDYANAPELRQISAGETLFRDRCSSCHDINGGNKPLRNAHQLGPDLYAVSKRRDPQWLRRWLAEPDKMLAEGDPIATAMYEQFQVIMPNFRLESHEIEALITYMASESQRLQQTSLQSHDHNSHDHASHDHGSHDHAASLEVEPGHDSN
jgi:protein SCO1/2